MVVKVVMQMEEPAFLTEEIVFKILTFLPVKSLIRFTCVSKRFHHIILSDSKFAKAQYEAACELKTLTHKLLIYKRDFSQFKPTRDLESVELDGMDAPVFGHHSTVRKVTLPFEPPAIEYWCFQAQILGSSNGIVFLSFYATKFYIWNPSTGFFKRLPDFVSPAPILAHIYGVGYMPATDDYKIVIECSDILDTDTTKVAVFSMRCNTWKNLSSEDAGDPSVAVTVSGLRGLSGILLNQALHWTNREDDVVSFDLAEYKFSVMAGPNFNDDDQGGKHITGIVANDEGFLTLVRHLKGGTDCVHVWVMKVYGVSGSWTKLFNLKIPLPPEVVPASLWCNPVRWVMENCMVVVVRSCNWKGLVRSYHREERMHDVYEIGCCLSMIRYQETLIKID